MPRQHEFASREEADVEKQRWKEALPPVPSAYRPSGKMPPDAIQWMTGGVVLGIPAGAATGAVVGAIGIAISVGLAGLAEEASRGSGRGMILLALATIVAVLVTFFGMFIVLGLTASRLVVLAGKRGKNRSQFGASALSITAALGAIVPFWVIMSQSPQYVEKRDAVEALTAVFGTGGLAMVCLGLGAICAAITAGASASSAVKEAKFCETCEFYMDSGEPRPVSFTSMTEAVKSLDANNTPAAAAVLVPVAKEEEEGSLKLFLCPQCRAGYAEIKASFSAKWPKRGKKKEFEAMAESWQVASKALPPGKVDVLSKAPEQKQAQGA